ncbi:hydrolase, partial [Citrobacter freundii]
MQSHYKYGEMFCDSILTSYRIYGDPASQLMPLIIL